MFASVGVAASYWQRSWECFINNMVMKQNTTKQPLEDRKEGLHTQGEWKFNQPFKFRFGNVLIETEKQVVCRIMQNDYDTDQEAEANAELIVKAVNERKALLDSLKLMFDCYNSQTILNHQNYEKIKNLVEGMG